MAKILIIEDTAVLMETLMEWLELEGFEVIGAATGELGLQMIRAHQPDLIVCDVVMPGMSGNEVIQAVRSDSDTAAIPFIFMTAVAGTADIQALLALGADEFMAKPIEPSQLSATIRRNLG